MRQKEIVINNHKLIGVEIDLPGAPLVLVKAAKGFVMCGYLNIDISEKFKQAAAIVKGIKTIEDLLNSAVVQVTTSALDLGIKPGMTGRQALEKMV